MNSNHNSVGEDVSQFSREEKYSKLFLEHRKYCYIIVNQIATKLNQFNIDPEDYFYDFYISFDKAYKNYDESRGNFTSFFKIIFRRKVLLSMIRYIKSKDALDHSISLDTTLDEGHRLLDVVANDKADDPKKSYILNNVRLTLREKSSGRTSKKNIKYKILMLRARGLTLKEIADMYKTNVSKIRRIINSKNNDNDDSLDDIFTDLK